MNTIKIMLLAVLLLFFIGCDKNKDNNINSDETIYGSGRIVSQTRTASECSGVKVNSTGNVYLTLDTKQSIRIEADDNIIDKVIAREENNVLVTGLSSGSYSNITLKIYVSLKTISQLSIVGAGSIRLQNSITAGDLGCFIDGAGLIYVKGTGDYLDCLINGAGTIDAKDFTVPKCKVVVNGAGVCTVYTTSELDAVINGAGIIYYYGDPPTVNTSIIGAGQIVKK